MRTNGYGRFVRSCQSKDTQGQSIFYDESTKAVNIHGHSEHKAFFGCLSFIRPSVRLSVRPSVRPFVRPSAVRPSVFSFIR